jgi:hypothetical protein
VAGVKERLRPFCLFHAPMEPSKEAARPSGPNLAPPFDVDIQVEPRLPGALGLERHRPLRLRKGSPACSLKARGHGGEYAPADTPSVMPRGV